MLDEMNELGLQNSTVPVTWELSGTEKTELPQDCINDAFTWEPISRLELPLPIFI